MLISYNWLKEYIKDVPTPEKLVDVLSLHAFEVEGLEEKNGDTVIDIDVLPNRSHDALSHDGIAREVATLLDTDYTLPTNEYATDAGVRTSEYVELTVENEHQVPRATKRLFTDVEVGESPAWVKERLSALGQRSINNVVDITNLVMFETGQPVHAFDFDKIKDEARNPKSEIRKKKIVIRGAKKGEKVATLDGEEWELEEGMLVIADDEQALDIAGVKGGAHSGVDENTTRVLLSACNFSPTHIRKTSRTLGLITDASKRFEQGITPAFIDRAHDRAAYYLSEFAGATVAEDVMGLYPHPRKPYKAGVSLEEIHNKLGADLSEKEVGAIFDRLGFVYEMVTPREQIVEKAQELVGKPYKYGASISYDAPEAFDCSSFTAYLYAGAGIGIPRMTPDQYVFGEQIEKDELKPGDIIFARNNNPDEEVDVTLTDGTTVQKKTVLSESKECLPGTTIEGGVDHNGIYLGDGKIIHASGIWHKGEVVIEDLDETPAFKTIVGYRRMPGIESRRFVVTIPSERIDLMAGRGFFVSGNSEDLIEEIGRVYGYFNIEAKELPKAEKKPVVNKEVYYANKIRDLLVRAGFSEVMTYSLVNEGDVALLNPFASDKSHMRTTLKEGITQALEMGEKNKPLFGVDRVKLFEIGTVFTKDGEHTALALGIGGKKTEGVLGEIQEAIAGIVGDIAIVSGEGGIFEINNISEFIEKLPEPEEYDIEKIDVSVTYQTPPSFPFVLRDIALWVPEEVESDKVHNVIKEIGGELLVRVDKFDEYAKDGRVSYAFHLVFQSYEKTLTDDEVNPFMSTIEKTAGDNNWEVR